MALGVWAAVGSGGAKAFGPLIGGIFIRAFLLGIGFFLINADCAGRQA